MEPINLKEFLEEHRHVNPGTLVREAGLIMFLGMVIAIVLNGGDQASGADRRLHLTAGVSINVIFAMITRYGIQKPSLKLTGKMILSAAAACLLFTLCYVPLILAADTPDITPMFLLSLFGSVVCVLVIEEVTGLRFFAQRDLLTQAHAVYERRMKQLAKIHARMEETEREQSGPTL